MTREEAERKARETQEAMEACAITPLSPAPAVQNPAPTTATTVHRLAAAASMANRPTDDEIIEVLARQFGVTEITVVHWLRSMDIDAAGAARARAAA